MTERDIIRKVSLKGRRVKDTLCSEIMTEKPIAVSLDYTLEQCISAMVAGRCRRLPVVGPNKDIVGVVSVRFVLEKILEQLKEANVDLSRSVYGKSVLTLLSEKSLTKSLAGQTDSNTNKFTTINPSHSVYEALLCMNSHNTGM